MATFSKGNGTSSQFAEERRLMVESQIRKRGVADERVLLAMATVPRHEFAPASGLRGRTAPHRLWADHFAALYRRCHGGFARAHGFGECPGNWHRVWLPGSGCFASRTGGPHSGIPARIGAIVG